MANSSKNETTARRIWTVTYYGMVVNIVLCVVKVAVGSGIASLSLVADGIHSLSDLATDVAVLLGSHFGARKPDQSHPYGHGRIETFTALLVAAVLMAVGGAMIYRAMLSVAETKSIVPHWGMLGVALLSILAKEAMYRVTRRVAVASHSTVLYANAWHHRSDALSSVAVVVGYVLLRFGYHYGDQVAAIAVGLMVILVGVKIVDDSVRELTEGAVDPQTVSDIKAVIDADEGVHDWHRLRSRTVGREVFLDVHILVDPSLNVADAHAISERLERALDEEIARPVNLTVHIEPDLPQFRK